MSLILPGLVVDHIRFYQRLDQKKELLIKIKNLQQEGYYGIRGSDDNLTLKTSLNKLEQYYLYQCHRKLLGQASKYDRNSINSFLYRNRWNFSEEFKPS